MSSKSRLISTCFFGYAIAHATPRVLLYIAAEDIVSGTLIQSSLALLLYSCGDIPFRVFAMLVFNRIPLPLLVMLLGVLCLIAYFMLIAVTQVKLRLAGAFFIGGENAISNVIIFNIMTRFRKVEEISSAFQFGVNVMTLLSALLYTGK